MKARLIKVNEEYQILCEDGTIVEATPIVLSDMLRNFKLSEYLKDGELGRWDTQRPDMFSCDGETMAYICENTDGDVLIIHNFKPFEVLFEKPSFNMDNLISVNEYASAVGKSVEQVKVHLRNNRIPDARKIGRDWVIAKSSITKYPLDQRVTSGKYLRK
jgi:hypothetical protein